MSGHQAQPKWSQVRASGRRFVFVKATEGVTFKNPLFDADWQAASQSRIVRGAYHYFKAADDPVQQADFFLGSIGRLGEDDLAPVMDWEEAKNVEPAKAIERARIFLDRVESATGKRPILYTYPSFWRKLGSPAGFDRYPLFIADYDGNCPDVPSPWKDWAIWQYGVKTAPGVAGPVDLDVFNGPLSALRALTL